MNLLYKQIEQAIRNHALQMSVPKGTTQDDVYQCIRSIMRENPEIFWFSHQWKYTENDQTIRFHYTIDKEKSLKAKNQIDDVVQNDFRINEIFRLSVPEQVMYVYKWIALYCKYNIYSAYNQTIYSVFVCRNSVCTGYAKAAQYLFKVLGIESRLVFGTMHNAEKGSRHCWLVVNINGVWYHIDPTFAVPDINDLLLKAGVNPVFGAEGLVYNYFCCDTRTIKKSRIIEDEGELPKCDSIIDFKPLQNIPVQTHRNEGAEELGVRGCLLSDSGSFASVYLWHSDKNIQSVVKRYKHDPSHELLWHECRIMREMASSRAVIHACGVTDDQNGLIIEQATPLADLLCSHYYQLSATNFCKLLLDVLSGIRDCLNHGIYYRDIHLNNIYRISEGRYVLGDFGSSIWIDKDNPANIAGVGSPWYSSPETYKNGVFDERSATYGIGMLAYFLLNELFPPLWAEYGEESLRYRIEGKELPSPALLKKPSCAFEQQLASIIKKSLSFDSARRYQSLSDSEMAIRQCLALVENDDYLLLDGGSSERLFKFDGEKGESCRNLKEQIIGNSSRIECSNIPVSDEETEEVEILGIDHIENDRSGIFIDGSDVILVDAENDGAFDVMAAELDSNGSIGDNDIIDITSPRIDDFAYTAGNPFDFTGSDDVSFEEPQTSSPPPKVSMPVGSCRNRIDDFANTAIGPNYHIDNTPKTYQPRYEHKQASMNASKGSFWSKIFGKKEKEVAEDEVYSSVFAPSEVKPKSHLMVQVYLHLLEESNEVERLAVEADKKAERRDYKPLQTRLKTGDVINVELNIYGESLLSNSTKTIRWQGKFTKCAFDYFVPSNLDIEELSCEVNLYVNGALVGDMRFLTNLVERPRKLNSEIISRMFRRIFISYAHQDSARVRDFALAYKAQGVDYFFDRDKLVAGDVYEEKIFEYIDSADLFILCWSANAANSEYVGRERRRAMLRAYPQLSHHEATLKIYPISIEPRTELPQDMAGIYNFEEV